MKKYILYGHDGSGNHGCEAIVRSTISLLGDTSDGFTLLSTRPNEDERYGLDEICTIKNRDIVESAPRNTLSFLRAYWAIKTKGNHTLMNKLMRKSAVAKIEGDIALSIGGDSYCYGEKVLDELIQMHHWLSESGKKTVLWGCSLEPDLLEDELILMDMKNFDLITARESITFQALKKVNPNTVLTADTAFCLETIVTPEAKQLEGLSLVGINLSPLVQSLESEEGITYLNYKNLIEHILKDTDMNILLIPHVVWNALDDRIILNKLLDEYKNSNRVFITPDSSCTEIKGYISKCRFFVGARTHATIAAYSCMIPTIVLGYSVKSKGIAQDLFGTYENYVLPVQDLKTSYDLVNAFQWMLVHEDLIKHCLHKNVPICVQRCKDARQHLFNLR